MKIRSLVLDDKTGSVTISIDMDDGTTDHRTFEDMSEIKKFGLAPVEPSREDLFRLACQLICQGEISFDDLVTKEGIEIAVEAAKATEVTK